MRSEFLPSTSVLPRRHDTLH